jgi:hypothetical protein
MSEDVGDVFVIASCEGMFWGGEGWVERWTEALQFGHPLDAYSPCEAEALRVRDITGRPCAPLYVPLQEAALADLRSVRKPLMAGAAAA